MTIDEVRNSSIDELRAMFGNSNFCPTANLATEDGCIEYQKWTLIYATKNAVLLHDISTKGTDKEKYYEDFVRYDRELEKLSF